MKFGIAQRNLVDFYDVKSRVCGESMLKMRYWKEMQLDCLHYKRKAR